MQEARIHPTAIVSAEAELAPDVVIGPYAVIEGAVKIGPGCIIKPYVHLIGPMTLGCNNQIYTGCIIGEAPQHLRYNNEDTRVEIGDNNVIREHVTIHRGTTQSYVTRIGNNNFLMAHSHVAHDCHLGNNCTLTNGALLGGHCVLADNVIVSGNAAAHQFVHMGRFAMLSGLSAATKDIPPFVVMQSFNVLCGVNVIGMRRAGIKTPNIDAVRKAFQILFRQGHTLPYSMAIVERDLGNFPEAIEMIEFIRHSARGVPVVEEHVRLQQEAA